MPVALQRLKNINLKFITGAYGGNKGDLNSALK
jgi:hypothetical protein